MVTFKSLLRHRLRVVVPGEAPVPDAQRGAWVPGYVTV